MAALAHGIVGCVTHEDRDAVIGQAPLKRLDDRKREAAEAVVGENANRHRARPMQALRQIVRPVVDRFRRSRDSFASLLTQAAIVVQGFRDRADADIRGARDIADSRVRARGSVLASSHASGWSDRLFSHAVRIQCSFHRAAGEPRDVVFLQEHIKEHAGNDRNGDSGLQQAPIRTSDAGLLTRIRENKRQGESDAAVHDHQGAEELVP